MDTVVIVLLVLLGVIVLTKGKPLWSFVKDCHRYWIKSRPEGWTVIHSWIIFWIFLLIIYTLFG